MQEEKTKEEKKKIEERKLEETTEKKQEEKKAVEKTEEKIKEEKKTEGEKGKKKKKEEPKIVKKDKAIVDGKDLRISTKHAVALCNFIRGRKIEKMVSDLEKVMKKDKAVKMKGEIPHRKGKGMERGRYPIKAAGVFIKLLKSLAANSSISGLENPYIFIAKANIASRPYRRFGQRRFKRSHVYLEARERKEKEKAKEEKK